MIFDLDNSNTIIIIMIVLLILISYALQISISKQTGIQDKIELIPADTSIRQAVQTVLGQLFFAGIIVGTSLYAGGIYFEIFAGGYLLALSVGVMLSIQLLLYFRALSLESSAEGKIKFSTEFGYKNMAHRLFSAGLLLAFLYALFGDLPYLGGVLFTWSTASGYVRRASKLEC